MNCKSCHKNAVIDNCNHGNNFSAYGKTNALVKL